MKYYFVIDTDTYAGNFERETCAYVTGQVGECGVGQKVAHKNRGNIPEDILKTLDDSVMPEPDKHGCHRPCKIYPTPGFYNNGLGFEFVAGEEDKAIKAYAKYCREESKKKYYADDAANKEHNEKWLAKADNAANEYGHYPSCQSVAIGFYDKPDSNTIELMKTRVEEFAKSCRQRECVDLGCRYEIGGYNILGYRLVTERTTTEEIKV